jgi:hypothetical protein
MLPSQDMKTTRLIPLLPFLASAAHAAGILSVTPLHSDAFPNAPSTGTEFTGTTFLSTQAAIGNHTVQAMGHNALAYTDRTHVWAGYGAGLGQPKDAGTFPSYLTGLSYVMTMNGNRDNILPPFSIDITTAVPGTAYLFIDNRLGDGVAQDAPSPSLVLDNAAQWIIDEGWVLMNTGAKPADYTGNNDILGIDEGNDGSINQYASIYSKEINGTQFTVRSFGEGRNMYGVAFAGVPEPSSSLLLGAVAAAALHRRRRTS